MALEYIPGPMEVDMKVNGKMTICMAKVYKFAWMAEYMKESTLTI